MSTVDSHDSDPISAGDFGVWLANLRRIMRRGGESDVACGTCTGCCSGSQFVHIEPDEHVARAAIPPAWLVPAPGMPPGHQVIGFDAEGRCPMLGDSGCTIYPDRPRACRVYDCRVFAAAGVEVDEPEKTAIAHRARRWVFEYSSEADRAQHVAMTRRGAEVAHDPQLRDVASLGRALAVIRSQLGASADGANPASRSSARRRRTTTPRSDE